MLPKMVLAAAALPILGLGSLACLDYAVVDVREGGPAGHHIVVPVPLAAARLALRFAPLEAREVELPAEAARFLPAAATIIDALAKVPDAVLVDVEDGGDHVIVRKIKDRLEVSVRERAGAEDVHVSLPLVAARRALNSFDGKRFRTRDLVAALGAADGELVYFRDHDTEVRVRIW